MKVTLGERLETPARDWSQVRAFALPSDTTGYVRLNLRGRERDGIVSPAAAEALRDEIAQGEFDTLLKWLNSNIHVHGRKFTSDELTRKVCGESINADAYIAYLEAKFADIYGL